MSVKRNQKIIRHAHRILALQGPSIRTTQANTIRFPRGILQLESPRARLNAIRHEVPLLSPASPPSPSSLLPPELNKIDFRTLQFLNPSIAQTKSRRLFLGLRSARSILHIGGCLRGLRSLTDLRMILTPGRWNSSKRIHEGQ